MGSVLLLLSCLLYVLATPAPEPVQQRSLADTLSDFLKDLQNGVSAQDIIQGILPDFFRNIPGEDSIKKQLGLDDRGISALPFEFLSIPGYGNYTSQGWNLRIRGQAYKQPLSAPNIVSTETLDAAAEGFLGGTDVSELQPHEQENARNLTSAILSLPQEGVRMTFSLDVASGQDFQSGWKAAIEWPELTDSRGEIGGFIQLPTGSPNELPNSSYTKITRLNVHSNGTDTGNTTGYLVPKEGITIISDIDDVLRVTKIYLPKEGLLNSFARDFVPWLNMPSIYADWSSQHPDAPYHFHYLTTTPEQATRVYMDFIYKTYPLGSFDTRPLNFTTVDQTFAVRKTLLYKVFQTFPNRKFVLVGDTTNNDVMGEYPDLVRTFPGQVHCILLRNTSATDPENRFPYNTKGFSSLKQEQYMFFNTPDDLKGLDFGNGDCRNSSVQSGPVTFGWQGLPFGLKSSAGRARGGSGWAAVALAVGAILLT